VYVNTVPWVRIPLPPPTALRIPFSVRPIGSEKPRIPAVFGGDLWTAGGHGGPKSVLSPRIFSGPLDWGDPVRKSETQGFHHFPEHPWGARFASHSHEVRICSRNVGKHVA
jgi:hypothetical protein